MVSLADHVKEVHGTAGDHTGCSFRAERRNNSEQESEKKKQKAEQQQENEASMDVQESEADTETQDERNQRPAAGIETTTGDSGDHPLHAPFHSQSMNAESRDKRETRFATFVCGHPGCTYRSTWQGSIAVHKQYEHSGERPFACDHTGCLFLSKSELCLSQHKFWVHQNISGERCHFCEERFDTKSDLRTHMKTHEEDGHEMGECEDCSVNLRRSSLAKKPAVVQMSHLVQVSLVQQDRVSAVQSHAPFAWLEEDSSEEEPIISHQTDHSVIAAQTADEDDSDSSEIESQSAEHGQQPDNQLVLSGHFDEDWEDMSHEHEDGSFGSSLGEDAEVVDVKSCAAAIADQDSSPDDGMDVDDADFLPTAQELNSGSVHDFHEQ